MNDWAIAFASTGVIAAALSIGHHVSNLLTMWGL